MLGGQQSWPSSSVQQGSHNIELKDITIVDVLKELSKHLLDPKSTSEPNWNTNDLRDRLIDIVKLLASSEEKEPSPKWKFRGGSDGRDGSLEKEKRHYGRVPILTQPETLTPCDQYKKTQQEIGNCVFAELHMNPPVTIQDNKTFSSHKRSRESNSYGCKTGINSAGELFCYGCNGGGGSGCCGGNGGSKRVKSCCERSGGKGTVCRSKGSIPTLGAFKEHTNTNKCLDFGRINQLTKSNNLSNLSHSFDHETDHISGKMEVSQPQEPVEKLTNKQAKSKQKSEEDKNPVEPLKSSGTPPHAETPPGTPHNELELPFKQPAPVEPQKVQDKLNESFHEDHPRKSPGDQVVKERKKPQPCPSGKSGSATSTEKELTMTRSQRKKYYCSIYRYTAGMYPGINFGHRHCTKDFRMVPKTMGWLWNIGDTGAGLPPRRGWKPGAINKQIISMIKTGKKATGEKEKEDASPVKSGKVTKKKRPVQTRSGHIITDENQEDCNAGPQPPTLHVHKKDGAYFIAMNPLKVDSDDEEEERSPLMFKILPHEDEESTSSESSLEIEFTAPGAFRKKTVKPVVVEVDTQYSDPESVIEITQPTAPVKSKKSTEKKDDSPPLDDKKTTETPPSTKASEPKDNKWDADQPTQVAKTKK